MELCVIEWLPIQLYYVIDSLFIPAASCYGFHFVKRFFPLNLCIPPFPHVYFLFVHLLKIKAQSTVWASFECSGAEKQPVSISKHGFVCPGLCVLCLFQFFFPFQPPTSPLLYKANIKQCMYTKARGFSYVQISECRAFPKETSLTQISMRNIPF